MSLACSKAAKTPLLSGAQSTDMNMLQLPSPATVLRLPVFHSSRSNLDDAVWSTGDPFAIRGESPPVKVLRVYGDPTQFASPAVLSIKAGKDHFVFVEPGDAAEVRRGMSAAGSSTKGPPRGAPMIVPSAPPRTGTFINFWAGRCHWDAGNKKSICN